MNRSVHILVHVLLVSSSCVCLSDKGGFSACGVAWRPPGRLKGISAVVERVSDILGGRGDGGRRRHARGVGALNSFRIGGNFC